MASGNRNKTVQVSENSESTCVVCFKSVDIYSIGVCDHPVCYECSTRMRVLCKQMECPICRQEMAKVVFVRDVKPFSQFAIQSYPMDKTSKICFENAALQDYLKKLLVHECKVCQSKPAFHNIQTLKDHLRKEHEQFFCDLCLDNLKIFTWERRHYSRSELALHRRKGDPDNTSHRGHPLCNFCDQRYVDNDELFRHLRRDHFFCHFCDADGLNQYYCSYDDLRVHFRDSHFLCEEGDCKEEKFTCVFRTDIDLRAHRAQIHSQSLGKAATRQARTLELEFTLAPRSSAESRGRGQRRGGPRTRDREREDPPLSYEQPAASFVGSAVNISASISDPQQFPSLSTDLITTSKTGGGGSDSLAQRLSKNNRFTLRSTNGTKADEEFPSLAADSWEPDRPTVTEAPQRSVYLRVSSQEDQNGTCNPSGSNVSIQLTQTYPSNQTGGKARVTRVSSSQNIRVQPSLSREADFPALLPVQEQAQQQAQSNWVKKEPVKVNKAPVKAAPAPKNIRPLAAEDFPSLAPSAAKMSTATVSSWWPTKTKPVSSQPSVNKASSVTIPVMESWNDASAKASSSRGKKKKVSKNHAVDVANGTGVDNAIENDAERKISLMQIGELKSLSSQMGGGNRLDLVSVANSCEVKPNMSSKVSIIKASDMTNDSVKPKVKPPSLTKDDFPSLGAAPAAANSLFDRSLSSPSTRPSRGLSAGDLTPTKVTFTSSSGRSFPLSVEVNSNHAFLQPADFASRNQALITTITDLLGDHQDRFSQFRSLSAQFRAADVHPEDYYHHCYDMLGEDCFLALFPELLVLLPDIEKQQQLLKVHRSQIRMAGNDRSASTEPYVVCATCSQVLSPADLKHHLASHSLETHFPALNPSLDSNSAWSKR